MLHVVLYQPDIPQNCGTLLRLAACLGVRAGIIEPAGFPVSDRHFRRAGMDYLDAVNVERHASWDAFATWRARMVAAHGGHRLVLLSTRASRPYTDFAFAADDVLMVGRETAGVPEAVHAAANARVVVPMRPPLRSLNVAIAAAMVIGEALRQTGGFPATAEREGS